MDKHLNPYHSAPLEAPSLETPDKLQEPDIPNARRGQIETNSGSGEHWTPESIQPEEIDEKEDQSKADKRIEKDIDHAIGR